MLVQRMEKEGRKTESAEETGQMAVLSCIFFVVLDHGRLSQM